MHVLRAADAAGYDVVLGSNRQFADVQRVPTHWQVHPVFRFRTYTKYATHLQFESQAGCGQSIQITRGWRTPAKIKIAGTQGTG